jgi:TonB family protein
MSLASIPVPIFFAAMSSVKPAVAARDDFSDSRGVGLVPAMTLVIWVCCLIVGAIGMIWPDIPPGPAATQPQSTAIEAIQVDVTNEPSDQPELASPPGPPLAAVASPDPLMVLSPLNPPSQPMATPQHSVNSAPPNSGPVAITLGVGEGRQPTPEYPEEARYAGEEGTVTIVFNVAADGSVTSATAATPCQWPILNEAALRAVRQTWHFAPGPPRTFIVAIRYELRR